MTIPLPGKSIMSGCRRSGPGFLFIREYRTKGTHKAQSGFLLLSARNRTFKALKKATEINKYRTYAL
jgi:hypothetical protein